MKNENGMETWGDIQKGTVIITGVTVQKGKTRNVDCKMNGEYGGGIYNRGDLTLYKCCIKNNHTGGEGWGTPK